MSQDWNEYADRIQKQLPAAPEPLLDAYIRWVPWVYLIFGILGLVFGVMFVVLGAVLTPLMVVFGYAGSGLSYWISILALLVGSALGALGGWGMMQRRLNGWWLIAIGLVINALYSLLTFHILNLVILLAFGYVHLSVKPRYT